MICIHIVFCEYIMSLQFIKVCNKRGQILELQSLGMGPFNLEFVAVTLYQSRTEISGNPRLCFEVVPDGPWLPTYLRDDSTGEEINVYMVKPPLALISTAKRNALIPRAGQWDRELKEMGFLEAVMESKYYPLFKGA